jgi:fructose-1,6-bisphosphatase/inositol monophosphatase family enzyme
MTGKSSDVAAGSLLVAEAGGRIGDLMGRAGFMKTGEAIAAAPGVFNPLREAIAAARVGLPPA